MLRNIQKKALALLSLTSIMVISCDYLDVVPAEIVTEDKIFQDITLAQQDLGSMYHDIIKWTEQNSDNRILRDGPFNWTGCAGDEMIDHWGTTAPTTYFKLGGLTTSYNPLGDWSWNYALIRKATNFINKIENVPLTQSQQQTYGIKIKQFKQEARFLRAYMYFDLMRQYGAVPLITEVQDISNVTGTQVSRDPIEKITEFICNELDEAASILPDSWNDATNYGRISRAACLALKARTLLYAASPLYNGNVMYKDIKNNDGTLLFPQIYDKELWKKAADAAQIAIDCCLNAGIKLSQEGANPINKYEKIFYNNSSNSEFILASIQTYGIYEDVSCNSHAEDKGGWGRFSIMQNQVDAYETADGYLPFLMDDDGCIIYDNNGQPSINPESKYNEVGFTHIDQLWDGTSFQPCTNIYNDLNGNLIKDMGKYDLYNMYVNRDPRFYASLTFQGAKFRNNTEGNKRCYHFAYWRNLESYAYWWVDGYPNVNTNNETGYGLRKFMNPTADIRNWIGTSSNFPLFRLSELYLIKAEALNEYYDTPTPDIYEAINEVRTRVNMPKLPITSEDNTKIGMRKRIRNERRVELFFEGHRFWDVRRWLVGKKCFGIPNYRMNSQPSESEIIAKAKELGYTSMTDQSNNPDYSWNRVWDSRDAGMKVYYKRTIDVNSIFSDKMYLFPIPQEDINKNSNLIQNYQW
ncbi:RagB/SusD family nutrient uptake outer membrane protein [Bacteroides graminisolvens]|uniref:RagB/SusD family nutrient uptake outer membrane protein n=1 Tax=Bacteroides graminisolvens TaxID=477666 RepID=UPI00240A1834|nr:RagB/SusD family nutrient uptake outer membrane protein [Bacteroides graminisolvens]